MQEDKPVTTPANEVSRTQVGLASALGAGLAGAMLMYYADPRSGRRRRAEARDRWVHLSHKTKTEWDRAARDLAHRAEGVRAELRKDRHEKVSDALLRERVRAQLGRYCSHPHAVMVECHDGVVRLSGDILVAERKALVRGLRSVAGVTRVDDSLHPHTDDEAFPKLQGGGTRRGPRPDVLQDHWAPATRVMVGGMGSGLLVSALGTKKTLSPWLAVGGGVLLTRAVLNRPWKSLLGTRAGAFEGELHKTLHIDAPLDEVFSYLQHLETIPRLMRSLARRPAAGESRRRARLPPPALALCTEAETFVVPYRSIAWKSTPGEGLSNSGSVQMERWGKGTRLHIHMTYAPPGGLFGQTLGRWLGLDPAPSFHEDLLRLQSLLETGKTSVRGHPVHREDLLVPNGQSAPQAGSGLG